METSEAGRALTQTRHVGLGQLIAIIEILLVISGQEAEVIQFELVIDIGGGKRVLHAAARGIAHIS